MTAKSKAKAKDRKTCRFCGGDLTEPSREHVLPQWLQKHLNAARDPVPLVRHRPASKGEAVDLELFREESTELRSHPASAYKAGRICADCNNGWMSALEDAVKPLFLPMLTALPGAQCLWSDEEKLTVARWTLKTACAASVAMSSDLHDLPDISDDHYRLARDFQALPAGMSVSYVLHPSTQNYNAYHTRNWLLADPSLENSAHLFSMSWKHSFQIKNLILTVAFMPPASGLQVLLRGGFHCPVVSHRQRSYWQPYPALVGSADFCRAANMLLAAALAT